MDNLLVKTFLGFAFLMLVLALALFLPAGSLRFWQAWVYLADFAGCTILITAYLMRNDRELLARRVRGGPPERQLVGKRGDVFRLGFGAGSMGRSDCQGHRMMP